MKITLTTGFGYMKRNGVVFERYCLPIGTHNFPDDAEVVEVADLAAMLAIVVQETPEQIKAGLNTWLDARYNQLVLKAVRLYLEGYGDSDNTALADLKAKVKDSKTKYAAKKAAIQAGATSVTDDFQL
jgi:hypothetical protein